VTDGPPRQDGQINFGVVVWCGGLNVNRALVEDGVLMVAEPNIPPPATEELLADWKALEQDARTPPRSVWREWCAFVASRDEKSCTNDAPTRGVLVPRRPGGG
jgi:hypothetical protein